jgi:hypothetical protein
VWNVCPHPALYSEAKGPAIGPSPGSKKALFSHQER